MNDTIGRGKLNKVGTGFPVKSTGRGCHGTKQMGKVEYSIELTTWLEKA